MQLKSLISLKLGTNFGFGELKCFFKADRKETPILNHRYYAALCSAW